MEKEDLAGLIDTIKVKVVHNPSYKATLHVSFKDGIPIDLELWVNPVLANDRDALRKSIEWAQDQLDSELIGIS